MKKVSLKNIADSFGSIDSKFSQNLIDKINSINLNYEMIENEELEKIYINIIDKLFSDKQKIGSFDRTDVWEKGWEENLNNFL